jgi:hypothetical protein
LELALPTWTSYLHLEGIGADQAEKEARM